MIKRLRERKKGGGGGERETEREREREVGYNLAKPPSTTDPVRLGWDRGRRRQSGRIRGLL